MAHEIQARGTASAKVPAEWVTVAPLTLLRRLGESQSTSSLALHRPFEWLGMLS